MELKVGEKYILKQSFARNWNDLMKARDGSIVTIRKIYSSGHSLKPVSIEEDQKERGSSFDGNGGWFYAKEDFAPLNQYDRGDDDV